MINPAETPPDAHTPDLTITPPDAPGQKWAMRSVVSACAELRESPATAAANTHRANVFIMGLQAYLDYYKFAKRIVVRYKPTLVDYSAQG